MLPNNEVLGWGPSSVEVALTVVFALVRHHPAPRMISDMPFLPDRSSSLPLQRDLLGWRPRISTPPSALARRPSLC